MCFKRTAVLVSLLLAPYIATAETGSSDLCTQSRTELEANKKLLRDFFSFEGSLEERADRFLTVDYIQHNPRLLRLDVITRAAGREAWVKGFKEAQHRGIRIVELGGIPLERPIIVMAECDLVIAIYKGVLNDPDHLGETYEAFAFEAFRVRDGKLSEHWDQVTLRRDWMQPPATQKSP